MPKIKTKRGAAKRFQRTASGKITHKKAYARHILTTKSAKRKRNLCKKGYVAPGEVKTVGKLIPYL